jgi:hypothetical protein
MRVMLFALVSGLALSVFGAALADPANTSAAAAAAAPEPMAPSSTLPGSEHIDAQPAKNAPQTAKGEKLICQHRIHEGTVLPQKICLTKVSWERIRLEEQKNVSDMELRSRIGGH